jgi:hypothetical protein
LPVRDLEPRRSGGLLGETDGESERKSQDYHADASPHRVTDTGRRFSTPYRQHDSRRENPGDNERNRSDASAHGTGSRPWKATEIGNDE